MYVEPKGKDLRLLSGDLLKGAYFLKKRRPFFLSNFIPLEQGSNMASTKAVLIMLNARW